MIDFTAKSCSLGMYLYCFVFYMAISLLYWRGCVLGNNQPQSNLQQNHLKFLPFFMLIWFVTEFSEGDFWHYQGFVCNYVDYINESFYVYLAEILAHNYLLFRIAVWGGALLLVSINLKRLHLNVFSGLYFLFVFYAFTFGYARASLAMSWFYIGISIIACHQRQHSATKKIFGYLIIISSFFLHHSMIVLIAFSLLRHIPITKKTILIAFLCVPVIGSIVRYVLFEILPSVNIGVMAALVGKAAIYTDFEKEDMSLLEHIREYWLFSLFYIPFLYTTYKLFFCKIKIEVPMHILIFYRISVYIVLLTFALLIIKLPNNILFYRYLYTLMIPNTIIITYFYQNGVLSRKTYKLLMLYAMAFITFRCGKKALGWSGPIT